MAGGWKLVTVLCCAVSEPTTGTPLTAEPSYRALHALYPLAREAVEELLFRETTTLGVRRQEWDRTVLDREVVAVPTAYGPVGVKVGRRDGRVYNAQPEFEDCVRAAKTAGVPIKEAWAAALAAFRSRP